ncbi:hypothetical protein A464_2135 [Salmonella bongori N268-08]|uniref:Uncharacterized protein n=1 Tax=Salmonella bongori N268-08 TaxID=1197719 RepID=S5N9P3_SALBN|nr:hypothetical protein A464_2135 [Salmonella bongori N268-08]
MTKRPVSAGRFAVEKHRRRSAICCYQVQVMPELSGIS